MAINRTRSYAVTAGLSCGLGIAVPAVAFAATLPFDAAHDVVSAAAVPFGVGALAGVGVFALGVRIADARAEAREAEGDAYAVPHAQRDAEDDVTRFFGGRRAPKDVPIIARAQGAPSEEDAWAEIDELLTEDSPISCDPVRSKDIYEIAFEELRREASRGAEAAAPQDATPEDAAVELERARREALASLDNLGDGTSAASPRREAVTTLTEAPAETPSVPMADYAGHQSTWEAALAILAEPEEVTAPEEAKPYVGRHFKNRAATTMPTPVPPSPERAVAVDEGARATQQHTHVNAMIEEEFDRVMSQSVRHTSREYLRVIQGGTASLPRIPQKAEA